MGMCCVVRWIASPCFGLHFIVMSRAVTPIHCAVCPVLPVPWILFFILFFFSVSILLIFQFLIKMMCLLSFHMICLTFFSFSLTYNLPCFFFFFLASPSCTYSVFGWVVSLHLFLLNQHPRALWSLLCLRPNWQAMFLSFIVTWWEARSPRSSGGMRRSTRPMPSSSCGMVLVSNECPSTQPTVPMQRACWASPFSVWKTLGPMNVEPAMTHDVMTCTRIQPLPGSVPRPL